LPPPSQGTNPTYLPEIRTELKVCETNAANSSVDEPTEVELKELPPHLEYAFLEGVNKLPVIIAFYVKSLVRKAQDAVLVDDAVFVKRYGYFFRN
ncbi:hypothetical protein Tco_1089044, partial [Tanacetum coccineum]